MTAVANSQNTLFTLMKSVSDALKYDRAGRNEDAYRQYLECVLRVATTLLKNVHADGGHVRISPDVTKMVKLGQQCMDRVAVILNERLDNSSLKVTEPQKRVTPGTGPGPPRPAQSPLQSPSGEVTLQSPRQVTSPVTLSPVTPEDKSSIHSQYNLIDGSTTRRQKKKLSPMEMATRQNQQLLSAFKARQSRQGTRSAAATLSLTLQRKMAENLAIAKVQEEILAKKMKERQQRLEEQAARRFHTPMGLAEEEQLQRQVYRRVLEFEQEELWMVDLRKRLEETPNNTDVISQLITTVLECETHPLSEQLQMLQNKLLNKIYPLVKGKEAQIDKIIVPLPDALQTALKEEFCFGKPCVTRSKSTGDIAENLIDDEEDNVQMASSSEKDLSVTEDSDKTVDRETDENSCVDTKEGNEVNDPHTEMFDEGEVGNDNIEVEEGSTDNKTKEESSVIEEIISKDDGNDEGDDPDLDKVCEHVKNDLKDALTKSDLLTDKLENENRNIKILATQITEDYEKYNEENMDDLFDDDDEEAPDIEFEANGIETNTPKMGIEKDNNSDNSNTESQSDLRKDKENVKPMTERSKPKMQSLASLEKDISKLKSEAYCRHLQAVIDDILTSIEKLQVLFVIAFEQLDSAEGRDQCNVLLEKFFFKPLWSSLLLLFRLANEPKERILATMMTVKEGSLPEEFQVRDKLCLTSPDQGENYPYHVAVVELRGIVSCSTMLEKLECLVRVSRMVMQCVEEYYRQTDGRTPSIGADDLLPVLCYIVVRSALPQIVSECHAMDKFIHEGYMFGEEGYCLTSFQTAINYLLSQGIIN